MARPSSYQRLLHELCVTYGHCGSDIHVDELLPEDGKISASQFAGLMLKAEKMSPEAYPESYPKNFRLIEEKFEQHLGDKIVDVVLLRH